MNRAGRPVDKYDAAKASLDAGRREALEDLVERAQMPDEVVSRWAESERTSQAQAYGELKATLLRSLLQVRLT